MSQSNKVIMWVVIAVVVIGGFWWYSIQQMNAPENASQVQNKADAEAMAAAQDSSDTSINNDVSALDKQAADLSADSASIDQSLNDQPIPQN